MGPWAVLDMSSEAEHLHSFSYAGLSFSYRGDVFQQKTQNKETNGLLDLLVQNVYGATRAGVMRGQVCMEGPTFKTT